mgnify:CR=1 FL=1
MISDEIAGYFASQAKKDRYEASCFRMSSIGHCVRKQVALRAGLPPTSPPAKHAQFKMWMGSELHNSIQSLLESTGFLEPTWTEREVKHRSYKGHVDGLTRKLPGTDIYGPAICEFKSTSDDAVTKYGWPEHYEWQALGCCMAAGVTRALLHQFGREYGLDREKIILLTPEWRVKLDEHITAVETAWTAYKQTGALPPCKHAFQWEDKTCPYLEPKKKEPKPESKPTPESWNPFRVTDQQQELSDFLDSTYKEGKDAGRKETND